MASNNGDNKPQPEARESVLLPVILAVALAVVAQLAVQDGLALLGLAGYVVAAWLFVASVRDVFDRAADQPATTEAEAEATDASPVQPATDSSRMAYLRHHWRLVTLAEIFRGDIPPARLGDPAKRAEAQRGPGGGPATAAGQAAVAPEEPAVAAARLKRWAAPESRADSAPRAVKVTPQGDVLLLDTGLEQVQRFDQTGQLLATYAVTGLAALEVADLAISPDGQTVYIVDAASNRLQVIELAAGDMTREEE